MKKLSSFVLIFLFAGIPLFSQDETLFGPTGLKVTGIWGGPMFGIAGFDAESAAMRGSFFGLEFNEIVSIGIGKERTAESVNLDNDKLDVFELDYKGVRFGYMPNRQSIVHPKFSFLMAGGETKLNDAVEDDVFVVQPGGGFEINVFKWFKVSVEAGYRFVSGVDIKLLNQEDLSGLYLQSLLRFGWSW